MITDVRQLPPRPNLEQYKKQAKELVKSVHAGDEESVELVKKYYPRQEKFTSLDSLKTDFKLTDAQFIIGRSLGFESWPKFVRHLESVSSENSITARFEQAADAIVTGDAKKLKKLLKEDPALIKARSDREHNGTLLHYVGSNGLEYYRQKTPANIVEIAGILLDAGADINAEANMYGGHDDVFGLAASSIHPQDAGVMEPLLEMLTKRGARIAGVPENYSPLMAAITNHRPSAVDALDKLGAPVDNLITAASVGRVDLVEKFLLEDGTLAPEGMLKRKLPYLAKTLEQQIAAAFVFAGVYGRAEALELMMRRGVAVDTIFDGFTALHWACGYGHMAAIEVLLKHRPALEIRNKFGGTVLDSTLWFVYNAHTKGVDYKPIIRRLIDEGASTDVYPEMQKWIDQALQE